MKYMNEYDFNGRFVLEEDDIGAKADKQTMSTIKITY